MKNKKSFTLLELLVVIAIAAGLLSLLVPNFMQVRIKSRDGRRKTDLRSIQKALELYKINQSNPEYPASLTVCSSLSSGGVDYMKVIPPDASSKCGAGPTPYYYARGGDTGTYTLCACLENSNDSEGVATCTGAPACSSSKYYQLTEP